jgi:hypothetical protein
MIPEPNKLLVFALATFMVLLISVTVSVLCVWYWGWNPGLCERWVSSLPQRYTPALCVCIFITLFDGSFSGEGKREHYLGDSGKWEKIAVISSTVTA